MIHRREFVAHAFLLRPESLDWDGVRAGLGVSDPVPGFPAEFEPAGEAGAQRLSGDEVVQVLVRRSSGLLVLSLVIGVPEDSEAPGPAWADAEARWAVVRPGELLGEARVLAAVADSLDDTGLAIGDRLSLPEYGAELGDLGNGVAVTAPPAHAERLSALIWSDGGLERSPLTRYLEHAARLRDQAGLLRRWHQHRDQERDEAGPARDLPEEGGRAELERLDEQLEKEVFRLRRLRADLEDLRRTCRIARGNLAAALGGATLPADERLAEWAEAQIEDDLDYLGIDQERAAAAREAVSGQRSRLERQPAVPAAPVTNRIFVVHGRDLELRDRFYAFLRAIGLHPLDWEDLVAGAGEGPSPYIGEVVARAPMLAQASVVLMSPDDVVQLHGDLAGPRDPMHETALNMQPRPNVIFELGQTRMAYPRSTLIVEMGSLRPIGDMLGVNVIRFDGGPAAVEKVVRRLELAGCTVDRAALPAWTAENRFADLSVLRRRPENGANRTE